MRFANIFGLLMAASATAAPNTKSRRGWSDTTETMVEDPSNPHQIYFYKQLSDVAHCGDSNGTASCTVGHNRLKAYTVGWGAEISAGGWVSAGLEVSKQETTGNAHLCTNEIDGELKNTICIWRRVGYTEYTVANYEMCWFKSWFVNDWERISDPFQMWSPNKHNRGYAYVCAWDDECENIGAERWGSSRTPGGPSDYPFDARWQ